MARKVALSGGGPWGFTLTGGKDFGSHLQVSKLNPTGKAKQSGVCEHDYILEINDTETQGITHHEAQQLIRTTGTTLTLLLSSEAPQRSAYAPASTAQATTGTPPQSQGGRPRPPPPPAPTGTTTPTKTTPPKTTPTKTTPPKITPTKPSPAKPAQRAQPPQPVQPVVQAGSKTTFVESNTENDPIFQSPAFKKITPESPSALSPNPKPVTPTQQMKEMTFEDGNTRKSTQRPPPPSNTPTTFTATTMKVGSNAGPKGPVAKPAPPPAAVKRPPPPPTSGAVQPSPVSQQQSPTQPKVTSRQGVCEACHEPIRGAYSSAMNKVWHPEHFICHRCHSQLSGGTFIFEEDKIFCNNCYEKQVAQICSFCRKPIVGPMVNATNRYYHQQCFKCSRCSNNLSNEDGFNMENGMLFCSNCFTETYGVTCSGCGQSISANELWVEALERNWHPQCFACATCKRPLEGSKFFAKLGQPYCGQC